MKIVLATFLAAFVATGCAVVPFVANNSPKAETPQIVSVKFKQTDGRLSGVIAPNNNGEFETLWSNLFRVRFTIPDPSDYDVFLDQDSTPLARGTQTQKEQYEELASSTASDIEVSISTERFNRPWDVFSNPKHQIRIVNKSYNPNFSGTDKVSSPLTVVLVRVPPPPQPNPPQPQSCRAEPVAGHSFAGDPSCGVSSANLMHDCANGFFCCTNSPGGNDPKCGRDKHSFEPDCSPACLGTRDCFLIQPKGCYRKNPP